MQTDLGLNFLWDVRKLWAVDLPVVPMRVRDLEWLLDKPFWKDGHRQFVLRPCDVAADPQRYQADYERAMAADLSCPNQYHLLRGRWVVMDDLHRLLKAWMSGHEMILASKPTSNTSRSSAASRQIRRTINDPAIGVYDSARPTHYERVQCLTVADDRCRLALGSLLVSRVGDGG